MRPRHIRIRCSEKPAATHTLVRLAWRNRHRLEASVVAIHCARFTESETLYVFDLSVLHS